MCRKLLKIRGIKRRGNGKLIEEHRRRWLCTIIRQDLTDSILENDRVCGKHFHSGKAAPMWDRFNLDWVPSLNLGHKKLKLDVSSTATKLRKG